MFHITTRCYGWGLPYTSMVPMVDNYNHSCVNVVQEIVHKRMHLEADESCSYFTKTKYMNDYSFFFEEELK